LNRDSSWKPFFTSHLMSILLWASSMPNVHTFSTAFKTQDGSNCISLSHSACGSWRLKLCSASKPPHLLENAWHSTKVQGLLSEFHYEVTIYPYLLCVALEWSTTWWKLKSGLCWLEFLSASQFLGSFWPLNLWFKSCPNSSLIWTQVCTHKWATKTKAPMAPKLCFLKEIRKKGRVP
jgi:hypothetical protein